MGVGVGMDVGVVLVEETEGELEASVIPRLGSELLFTIFARCAGFGFTGGGFDLTATLGRAAPSSVPALATSGCLLPSGS